MILIVDDDYSITASLELLLKQSGFACVTAMNPAEALERAADPKIALVLQDMNFSRRTTGEEGLVLLRQIRERRPELPVVLITAWGSIGLAVEGMKAGAADFITKPWSREQILSSIRTALDLVSVRTGPSYERAVLDQKFDFHDIIGSDPRLLEILRLIARVAPTDATLLISGQSGTGKERIAEAIHRNSRRRDGPFVKVNLGAIPAALFESEMFGHVRGAFTNAHQDRVGRFALAQHGTILLDEVGELDPSCQVKLLRVLQDRTYEPVGSSQTRTLDIRVLAATNRDLAAAVAAGTFREDLLYRLNFLHIRVPTLADRKSDIRPLAEAFLQRAAEQYGRAGLRLSTPALRWLEGQPWPGNVRQLEHVLERAALVSEGDVIQLEELRRFDSPASLAGHDTADENRPVMHDAHEPQLRRFARPDSTSPGDAAATAETTESMTVQEMERALIEKSLLHHAGNLSKVADSLGISRQALYRRLAKYGIKT